MKIPQIRSTEPLSARQPPQVNPSVYSLPARAGIGLGEAISESGSKLMEIVEREKQGREAIEVISAKTKAEIELKNLERNIEKDADFDNYEKNYVPQIDEVLKKYLGGQSIGVQRKLKSSFEILRGNSLLNLRSLRDKKSIDIGRAKTLETADLIESQIETESDPNELGKLYGRLDVLLDETGGGQYTDPSGKTRQGAGFFSAEHTQVLKNHYAGKIRDKIKKSNLNNVILRINAGEFKKEDVAKLIKEYDIPKEAWPAIQSHATTIEKTQKIEDDETNITNAIHEAKSEWPGSSDMQNILLTNAEWQKKHGLDSKTAHTAQIRLKAEQALIHDNDDRKVAELFMKKDYADALKLVELSGYLSGDEKKTWTTAIETARDNPQIDPIVEASNYAFVNELIAKEVDPRTIRKYIFSYEFKTATRQKLIDRLDTETDKAINKSKSRSYDYLKGQIMPYGGMLAEVPPLQSANYTKAMNALDDWIDKQRKADKPITPKDIQAKAEELAIEFQTSIAERQDYTAKENKEYFESLKKKKEKKIETQPTEEYEINKVYTDSQGRKAKYLGGGKWQLVKK